MADENEELQATTQEEPDCWTRERLEAAIAAHGGSRGLDLSDRDFSGADLSGLDLRGVNLRGATLERTILTKAFLERCNLSHANLWRANLEWANLWKADLQYADLERATCHNAVFRRADLRGANLLFVDVQRADLYGAALGGTLIERHCIEGGVLHERASDYETYLQEQEQLLNRYGVSWATGREHGVSVEMQTRLEERFEHARAVYLAVKNNFSSLGQYDDASWAYRKERRMEKLWARQKAREARSERTWREAVANYAKFVGDQLVEWLCDYGEGIWRVVGALVAVWIIFALIYGLIAGVWGPWQETAMGQMRGITRNPIHLLAFSLGAMTTLEPAGLEARSMLAMHVLMPLEALMGIFLAGLLGFVAGNRIRRS